MDQDLEDFRNDVEELRFFRGRKRKVYNVRVNQMELLSDEEFKIKYRFSKENMYRIINLVKDDLELDRRGGSIPPDLQVMAAIRSWGRHQIQDDTAETHGFSQQTLSRICKNVAVALASKSPNIIKMPSTIEEQQKTMEEFQSIAGFPHVIGAIDGCHIKIRKVGGEAGQFYINRKGHSSINVQVVCNASLKICDIVCHWRGSTHDARIFRESTIKQRFLNNELPGRLLGDSGYPCTSYLFTPVLRPNTQAEERYNSSHIRTRNTVERCFGVWKQRFRILLEVMRGSLETIKATIVACAVLHNLAIEFKEDLDNIEDVNNAANNEDILNIVPIENNSAREVFINNHFV